METTGATEAEERAALDDMFGDPVDPTTQAKVEEAETDRIVQQGFAGGGSGGGGGGSDLGVASAGSNQVRDDLGIEYSADVGDAGPFQIDDPRWEGAQLYPSPTINRMPAKHRKAQFLTDTDLRSLAESGEYPTDFMGEDYYINPRQPTESALAYQQIKSPYEREEFLRKRKDYLLKQREEKEARDYILQHPYTAYAAGGAVGLGGGVVAASSAGIGAFAAAVSMLPIFPHLPSLAKPAVFWYVVKKLYDDIRSDPNITEEEAQQKIQEEVQRQLQLQKDAGTPPVSDATKDTGKTAL